MLFLQLLLYIYIYYNTSSYLVHYAIYKLNVYIITRIVIFLISYIKQITYTRLCYLMC